ncbi:MAG: GatB/YqeY domain-containing protein [Alphaproteobacteria bacterium]|nr:GatB/YqeY domain-containing protein [Alphaproteobacteria bacterium]
MTLPVREAITGALKEATKAQQKRRMGTLRLMTAAIKDRGIQNRTAGKGDEVEESEVMEILAKMIKQRRESADTYEGAGRLELAEQEREEIVIIEEFLPKQMSEDDVAAAVSGVIAELGAEGLKDMGRTMGALKERFAGQMDFGKASALVKAKLG